MNKKTVLLRVQYPVYDWVSRAIEVEVDENMDDYDIEEKVRTRIVDAVGGSILCYPNKGDDVGEGVDFIIDHGIQDRGYNDDYNSQSEFRDWIEVNVEES